MIAEVIAIGSELTCGAKLDTNSQWLSRELEAQGWTVARHTALADDLTQIVNEFRAAVARSRVIIVTGGLGPTMDDITRDALAEAFQQPLIVDETSLQQIQSVFAARGRTMPERNARQAQRPEFSSALQNHCGTAPGVLMYVSPDAPHLPSTSIQEAAMIAVLPGVPAEMKPMFTEQVRPLLTHSGMSVHRLVIRSFGFGESDAERLLGELTARGRNPEVGITASEAVISLWVTARDAQETECARMAAVVRNQILERLGNAVFADGDLELHDVVAEQLLQQQQRVAFIEGSTTGGLLAHWFTENPQHADCMVFGNVYSSFRSGTNGDQSNSRWEEFARQQALEILQANTAEFILLSSPHRDLVNPDGVLLKRGAIAVAGKDLFEIFDVSMSGNLAIFRQRAARMALNQLRLHLKSCFPGD